MTEMMAVMLIIVGLLVIVTPYLVRAQEAARRIQCGNNLKQLGLAMLNYHELHGSLPPSAQTTVTLGQPPSTTPWTIPLMPYMEQQNQYQAFDSRLGVMYEVGKYSAAPNGGVLALPKGVFQCPTGPSLAAYDGAAPAGTWPGVGATAWTTAPLSYSVASGVRGEFARLAYGDPQGDLAGAMRSIIRLHGKVVSPYRPLRLQDISDGASCTCLLGERTGGAEIFDRAKIWRAPPEIKAPLMAANGGGWGDPLAGEHWLAGSPRDFLPVPPEEGPCGINCTNLRHHGFHSFHHRVSQFLLADGSVSIVLDDVDPSVLAALVTARQGELVETPPGQP